MKREIWKLNLKTCKKNLWMQSEQYSQRALNNLCNCVTEPIGWRQYFCPSPSKWVSFWSKCNLTLPPRNIAPWHSPKFQICRLGSHRNFACVKRPLFKSFQKWPNMANFTTENNTYCFRIGHAFLDMCNIARLAMTIPVAAWYLSLKCLVMTFTWKADYIPSQHSRHSRYIIPFA